MGQCSRPHLEREQVSLHVGHSGPPRFEQNYPVIDFFSGVGSAFPLGTGDLLSHCACAEEWLRRQSVIVHGAFR